VNSTGRFCEFSRNTEKQREKELNKAIRQGKGRTVDSAELRIKQGTQESKGKGN
jgi:hypothetical protein